MSAAPSDSPSIQGRQITAAVIGNALEFYDFTTYALFASQIGQAFFPAKTPFETLMLSLLTYAVGFVGRPVGALAIGLIGDRAGRRPAMLLSFTLMGLAILGVVLTPSYAQIGALAPLLLVLFRLVQGFALGGEVGPTTAYLIEAARPDRRALVGSWQSASQSAANLVGAVVGLVISQTLSAAQSEAYGWRIAFALGALALPFGLYLRRGLPETLHLRDAGEAPERTGLKDLIRPMLIGLAMIMSFTTSTYVLLNMTTYASHTLHMSAGASFAASVASAGSGLVFCLLGGWLADRHGRKPVMIGFRALFLLAVFPAYFAIVKAHSAPVLIACSAGLSMLSSAGVGVGIVAMTEALRRGARSTGLALVYALGVTVFGGLAQPFVTWLIEATGNPLAPAWYLTVAAAVGIAAMAAMPETHPRRISGLRAVIETA